MIDALAHFIDWLFAHQEQIGLFTAIVCFLVGIGVRKNSKRAIAEKQIGPLLVIAFAGYSIPQGALFIYCCFDLSKLQQMKDLPLYIGVAGLSAISLAVLGIINTVKKLKTED